ncbi:electron transfer flavoprotein subunit beta [Motiliproteus sp. MSK22-1]|uniref:electron transfer flavoprotein subunit beta n=1 Tax=Motiliproteus sp. MSK22-1 TaxID=1897630 RepID=UPI0009764C94|nr:electron transfer flavoprotein subunit beta [Motiliproteus sp. MSK22-1]OMH39274.1 electron transfer flavoprotein subunit beta [Motiliproteus sp. MSK22-1]
MLRNTNRATDLKVISLVSVGCHPKSGRARRAEQDSRAVELGLKLAGGGLTMVHAGDHQQEALRGYLGMGLKDMAVIRQPETADVIPALQEYLQQQRPDIVLTGVRAERGEGSGMTPYLLAEQLGWPVVTRIADVVSIDNGEAEILQALPRGQRRALKVRLPFVASVDLAADAPRQSAFGPGCRGAISSINSTVTEDSLSSDWTESPARKRPKRLKVIKAKTAADRFKAATAKVQGGGGKVLKNESTREKAQAILDLLTEEAVLR